ncbi:MAG: 3-oxoacyl-[acyl-carrier-protein] synthase III C-terminal domain-containing protein [Actinomycetota bacterium]
MPHTRSRVAGLGVHLPADMRTTEQTELALRERNPDLRLATGMIGRLTGVRSVHLRAEGWQTSDLAAAAARDALADSPGRIDLLIFASASQDLIEPATSHIVAAKLGLDCPVMDVKNACNSVLNGVQVADALITTGQYRRVLIASGEQPSHAVRWQLESRAQFLRSFPGYTMSDGGAALILEASDDERGILGCTFVAVSSHWNIGTLGTGGSMDPHAVNGSHFDMNGPALQKAFLDLGPDAVLDTLRRLDFEWGDFDLVAIHQGALPYLAPIFDRLGVAADKSIITVEHHGNLASVTLPLQLLLARETGMIGPGSLVAMIGLAGGISLGVMVVRM